MAHALPLQLPAAPALSFTFNKGQTLVQHGKPPQSSFSVMGAAPIGSTCKSRGTQTTKSAGPAVNDDA
jgi:hypothetical protein